MIKILQLVINMHSLNAIFLLGDAALNSLVIAQILTNET